MKKLIFIIIIFLSFESYGQVAVGKSTLTNESSVLLEFLNDNTTDSTNVYGIVLPTVDNVEKMTSIEPGTFVFDGTSHKVMVYINDGSTTWLELTDDGTLAVNENGDSNAKNVSNIANTNDDDAASVQIGSYDASINGVLVLNSEDKALVLPKIKSPHKAVSNPYPGMMCYDEDSDTLAVYDGAVWSYWK